MTSTIPNYEEYIPGYPQIDDKDFFNKIVQKKEFWENSSQGLFFQHQINVARYMSQWTLYDSLFIFHEMGTGKSALTVMMTELLRIDSPYKRVLYITHNQTQITNYKNEIKKFSIRLSNTLKRETHNTTDDDRIRRKWNSLLFKDGYEFATYGTLSNDIGKRTDKWLKEKYEHCIIIIDEAHHLVQTNNVEEKKSYDTIVKLLSVITDKKLLVMSGTPMRDQPDEIVPLLNLIIPEPLSRNDFISSFFNVKENINVFEDIAIPVYEWKPEQREHFQKLIRGKVSYVRREKSSARIEYQGLIYPPMQSLRINVHRMNSTQNNEYYEIFKNEKVGDDNNTKKANFYTMSKQATLFVFPDDSTGEIGYNRFVNSKIELNSKFLAETGLTNSALIPNQQIIEILAEYSAVYAYVIDQIINHPSELVYVFSDLVKGSGILLFTAILKTLFKFKLIEKRTDLNEKLPGKRMILLNDDVANEDDFQYFINYFNRKENKNGDFCRVIMGTIKTKEGISLRNVRQVHILTPSWNIADTAQAMSRSLRARSHVDLDNPLVKIFLHVSVPFLGEDVDTYTRWLDGDIPIDKDELSASIDYQRYYRSEIKERNTKLIERVFLESSWDCLMNMPINTRTGRIEDGSRECEYDTCEYTCEGISEGTIPNSDGSNLTQFYSSVEKDKLTIQIKEYFTLNSYATMDDIMSAMKPYSNNKVVIEECLSGIIHSPILLRDHRNIPCFLSYNRGMFYLTDNPYLPYSNNIYPYYYQRNPATKVSFDLDELLDVYFIRNQKTFVPKLKRLINLNHPNAKKLFLSFSLDFQAIFCEITIQSQLLHPTTFPLKALEWFVKEFTTDISYVPSLFKIDHRFVKDNKKHFRRLSLKHPDKGWTTQ